jgi:sortase A
VAPGEALAYLRIPRFGHDWLWVVSEGTDMAVLDQGPGHFTGSALPGGEGNSAYAAHRSGHGDPFQDFETLRPGDEVTLSQSGASWTYTLTMRPRIIDPSEHWVVEHVPGHWLTLTTCWPKYGDEKRMFVRARLTEISD